MSSFEQIARDTLRKGGFVPDRVKVKQNSKHWFEMDITFGGVLIRLEYDKGLMNAFGSEEKFLENEITDYFPALKNAGVKNAGVPGPGEDIGTD